MHRARSRIRLLEAHAGTTKLLFRKETKAGDKRRAFDINKSKYVTGRHLIGRKVNIGPDGSDSNTGLE
ncbi:hypothetical protein CHISP_3584 [Chitinispirillum alkaliphilum]|nr:hypothetical protein CHISP_3584 [Chitinispirillum alkaliphilum]